jgi:hypothetical protein
MQVAPDAAAVRRRIAKAFSDEAVDFGVGIGRRWIMGRY